MKEHRVIIWNMFDKHCAYCGTEIEYKAMQIDHIEPKHLGGKNSMDNYNPSCRSCNFYKSTFSIEQFREQLETIHKRLFKIFIVKVAIRYGILKYKQSKIKFYFETFKKKDNE